MNVKKCKKCLTMKNSNTEFFYRDKKNADRLSSECKECIKERTRQWASNNKERKKQTDRLYADKNKERIRCYQKIYRSENKERASEYSKEYRDKNKDVLKQKRREYFQRDEVKKRISEHSRKRKKYDIKYRITSSVRSSLSGAVKRKRGAIRHVEWSIDDLIIHLERQFLKGMSWENYGEWHIDHIIPVSSFRYQSPSDDEFKACWSLSNLRPLWASDNCSKQDKIETLL